jgi:hypothetical protein
MTTLQARSWAHVVKRPDKARDQNRIGNIARSALGITILAAVFAAGIAIRVLIFVHLP